MPDITARTNALAHCTLLLQGLNPVPDQRRMWSHSFAFKGHRSADLLTRVRRVEDVEGLLPYIGPARCAGTTSIYSAPGAR